MLASGLSALLVEKRSGKVPATARRASTEAALLARSERFGNSADENECFKKINLDLFSFVV